MTLTTFAPLELIDRFECAHTLSKDAAQALALPLAVHLGVPPAISGRVINRRAGSFHHPVTIPLGMPEANLRIVFRRRDESPHPVVSWYARLGVNMLRSVRLELARFGLCSPPPATTGPHQNGNLVPLRPALLDNVEFKELLFVWQLVTASALIDRARQLVENHIAAVYPALSQRDRRLFPLRDLLPTVRVSWVEMPYDRPRGHVGPLDLLPAAVRVLPRAREYITSGADGWKAPLGNGDVKKAKALVSAYSKETFVRMEPRLRGNRIAAGWEARPGLSRSELARVMRVREWIKGADKQNRQLRVIGRRTFRDLQRLLVPIRLQAADLRSRIMAMQEFEMPRLRPGQLAGLLPRRRGGTLRDVVHELQRLGEHALRGRAIKLKDEVLAELLQAQIVWKPYPGTYAINHRHPLFTSPT